MRKLTVPLVVSLLLLAVPGTAQAGTHATAGADARRSTAVPLVVQKWSPWVRTPSSATDLPGVCAESIHLTFPVDRVEGRSRLIPGGNTEIESKGALVVELTPESQPAHHYRFDISGPSVGQHSQINYTNGDYLYRSTGATLTFFRGTSIEGTGLPRLTYLKGSFANLYEGSTRAAIITRPKTVVDVCRYMGLNSAP
jgi:hypothetical protein